MAKIGLIDVDGHNFPSLPLMKISAYHKKIGDSVEWAVHLDHYDKVYKCKVFSFTPDISFCPICDELVEGGTGYAIHLQDGIEVFEKNKDEALPSEIEAQCPDYSIYPQYSEAYGFLTRGCPRGCPFCIVGKKEGKKTIQVSDVSDFWRGQKEIKLLDPNILACTNRETLLKSLVETKAGVDFTQGLDIRLVDGVVPLLNDIKVKRLHFAWDNPNQDLSSFFEKFKKEYKRKDSSRLCVYVLTNFSSCHEEDLYRVYKLRELGFDPYVMIYNKEAAPRETRLLQRYVNNKRIFKSIERFEEYDPKKG